MDKLCLKNRWIMHPNFLLCIVTLITLLPISSNFVFATRSKETDRLALHALKEQLVGHGSFTSALSSWNTSVHFCEWEGVLCDHRHQRVVSLDVSSLDLVGSISPSIGNLTFLREVNLSYNYLQGRIPREIGHLRRLRYLNLQFNYLRGRIPREIGHGRRLGFLNLEDNYLQGNIPMELTNCSNLNILALKDNYLIGEIPFQLGNMKNLFGIHLAFNNLTGGIPSSLGNLSSLYVLALANNSLEGTIPDALGRLSTLQFLYLGMNNLSGSISPLYNISSLILFSTEVNQLSGTLPPDIDFVFPNLEVLSIGGNHFMSGTIPKSISNISSLQHFLINDNGFSGSIPDNIGNLWNLQLLHIHENHFGSAKAGDLDFLSSLSNCSQLEYLAINNNRFGGVIPNSIANLSTTLQTLWMGNNQFIGKIPEGIGNLVSLNRLAMDSNFLTGEIPISIRNFENLEGFDLSSNYLTGNIPASIGNLSRLSDLDLSTNKLEGAIPLSLKECKNLQRLELSQNKLNGNISYELLDAFEKLIYLDLSHNSFTGLLPSSFNKLKALAEFYVDNNNFFGEIPKILDESLQLRTVLMQNNSFQGHIPQSFASLRSLENLDLSNNNLTGTIPPKLQKLPFLASLNLSLNQLEGEVPKEGVFKNVSGFSFFGNKKLCGGIQELNLPKCKSKKKGKVFSTKVLISVILSIALGLVLVVFGVFLSWKGRTSEKGLIPIALFGAGYLCLSYKELLQATQDFASSNLIGSGNFGFVYKGVLHEQEKVVAVKVLNLQNRGAAKSFMAECKVLRKARHRNLLKVITACSSIDYQGNDFKALVFEFMPKGSLESWLHEQHNSRYLNLAQRLDIAVDVANAIDYLHHDCETLIVHCDLKPTNVLLDDDMVAHVGDFGLAKLFFSNSTGNMGSDQTSSSILKGTIGYIPPEYGMGGVVSPKGDIYSYGLLILEMITGRRPTDDLFHDGLSLHDFCKISLPEQLKEILDSRLLEEIGEIVQRLRSRSNMEREIRECLISFTKIGVACSVELPSERMEIKDALKELLAIKARLLRIGLYRSE